MKKFILDVLSSIIKSILVFALLFLISMSLYTGKFPPNITLIKQQITDLTLAKEKYINLISKSENYLNSKAAPTEDNIYISKTTTESKIGDDIENLKIQIIHIRSQLNRIEEQNNLLLNNLKK